MNHTQHFIQQRKLFMALPMLVTPFLAMIFWALGGGANAAPVITHSSNIGLVTTLPDAQLEGKEQWDKLKLYEQALADSMRYNEARENDPYFDLVAFKTSKPAGHDAEESKLINAFAHRDRLSQADTEPIEEKVQAKIDQLYKAMNSQEGSMPDGEYTRRSSLNTHRSNVKKVEPAIQDSRNDDEIKEMEAMMAMLGEKSSQPDPEMQQIEGVLDKILDIQHPERVKDRMTANPHLTKSETLEVHPASENDIVVLEWADHDDSNANVDIDSLTTSVIASDELKDYPGQYEQNSFYGLVDRQLGRAQMATNVNLRTAISAVVHDTQELVAGATVRMRLTEEVTIAGMILPKDQFVYGVCEISGERLIIKINSIRMDDYLLPVGLSAYDLDGLEGIHIPGAISRDAAKQGSANAIQSMQMMNVNPTIGAQAASAGIEAAKGLFSRKARLVKVTVKAGYQLLLKGSNTSFN